MMKKRKTSQPDFLTTTTLNQHRKSKLMIP